jgi:hypothetical protein
VKAGVVSHINVETLLEEEVKNIPQEIFIFCREILRKWGSSNKTKKHFLEKI